MPKLTRYTLAYDDDKENWKLENDKTDKVIRRYENKEDATSRGTLKDAVGKDGGSVRIEYRYKSGYDEERTYPRSRDPRSSKG